MTTGGIGVKYNLFLLSVEVQVPLIVHKYTSTQRSADGSVNHSACGVAL